MAGMNQFIRISFKPFALIGNQLLSSPARTPSYFYACFVIHPPTCLRRAYASSTTVVWRPLGSLTLTAWTYEYSFSLAPSSSLRLREMRTRRRNGTPLMPDSHTFLLSWGSRRTSLVPCKTR